MYSCGPPQPPLASRLDVVSGFVGAEECRRAKYLIYMLFCTRKEGGVEHQYCLVNGLPIAGARGDVQDYDSHSNRPICPDRLLSSRVESICSPGVSCLYTPDAPTPYVLSSDRVTASGRAGKGERGKRNLMIDMGSVFPRRHSLNVDKQNHLFCLEFIPQSHPFASGKSPFDTVRARQG
ncbi:hypothetical protein LZ32DRAFT_405995 [Colletotrichum eremochloae]|nr:hypothetical protein LZ32DRAFT_405995 [Colletotrichum eremochloae]